MIKFIAFILLGVLLLSISGIAWLFFNQEKLLFFPEVLPSDFTFNFPAPFREGSLRLNSETDSSEKNKSEANLSYLIFNSESSKGTILYFHGNAGSLKDWGFAAAELAEKTGWSVWIMDYPGYGKSTGPLPKTEERLIAAGRRIRAEIEKTGSTMPLVLFGRSLGSGIAVNLAHEARPDGLILETPYRSIAKLGHELFPILPEFFSRFDLNCEILLPNLGSTPVLIFHGTEDEVIPVRHGNFLAQLMPQFRLVTIPGGKHNNLPQYSQYWSSMLDFLEGLTAKKVE